jgi:hypothetical protein
MVFMSGPQALKNATAARTPSTVANLFIQKSSYQFQSNRQSRFYSAIERVGKILVSLEHTLK